MNTQHTRSKDMAKNYQNQPRKTFPLHTDAATRDMISAFAGEQHKSIKALVGEIIYSHPRVKRFLRKYTPPILEAAKPTTTKA
jgi:hypothetical protein